jgi:putative membrane protein
LGAHAFFLDPAKQAIREAVGRVEKQTCAEVVVAIRRESGSYRQADTSWGITFALVLLGVFLYHPEPFDYTYLPLELAIAFALGSVLSAFVAPMRRAFVPARLREENARRAAKATFVDLGISRTKSRTGVLVFVAAFEQRVIVVPDIGVHPKKLGAPWEEVQQKLDRALRLDGSFELFLAALEGLGPALAVEHPRAHDDDNELSDAMDAEDEPSSGGEREAAR